KIVSNNGDDGRTLRSAERIRNAKSRTASDARVSPIESRHERNFQIPGIDAPTFHAFLNFAEVRAEHFSGAATKDDDFRLQQIDGVAKPDGEIFERLVKDFPREWIASFCRLTYHFAANGHGISICKLQKLCSTFRRLGQFFARAIGNG